MCKSGSVVLAVVLSALTASAQPLPKVQLRPVFTSLALNRPIWMCQPPDGSGRIFFVEQHGRIVIVPKGGDGSTSTEYFNIESRRPLVDNEEGLLSMAFHPGYKTNGLFYVYYNQQAGGNKPRRSVISEFKVSATNPDQADLASERILFEVPQPYGNHKGGELGFGPDGYLYLGLGDGGLGNDPNNNGQNTAVFLGKFLRIDVNTRSMSGTGRDRKELPYGIPKDNPYVNEPDMWGNVGTKKEIYALGMRNPWRWSWDSKTGDLWAGDVGQDLWEEVDLIVKGGNYGWCVREAFHHFKPGPPGAQYLDPVIEYPHRPQDLAQAKFPKHDIGMCVIGGYVYRGKKFPSLEGIYIYGDNVVGTIYGLRYADGKVTDYGTMLKQPKNIDSFAQDEQGELYILSFAADPQVPVNEGHVFAIESADGK